MDTEAQDELSDPTASILQVGDRFADRYTIDALIGRGGMGVVFRVHDIELDETVALKLLEVASASEETIERFRREVRLARRVTHRNAARTYDLGEHEGMRFLTMEFVAGPSLAELSSKGRMNTERVVEIGRQIAEGLTAAHTAQVVHRDLKPANVLVETGGRVVITDFGIARGLQASDDTLHTHGTPGTPAYMAPEQLGGERVGPAADVYSLGLILHELLIGELPYARKTVMETALARLHESPPDLATSHGVDHSLAHLLALMLSLAPVERPDPCAIAQALVEYQNDLEAVREDENSEVSTPTPIRRLALAVLPFLHRGPADTAYIGEVLSDELIDLLAMTKGLRVSASGATARYSARRDRDPRAIGTALGVDALVDGSVQVSGERVRISARLLDGETGFQRWSERFEGCLGDVFELQDKLCKRIAEALRVEVEHSIHHGDATPEAVEYYLRARQLARAWTIKGPEGALAYFARCLELAPSFKPALAGYAHGCLWAWLLPRSAGDPDWHELAAHAVEMALGWAPELAETHLCTARWAVQEGEYRNAARSLRLALTIAPTYAAAHEYLGELKLEGGRSREGLAHLGQALDLDPSLVFCLPALARYHALHGEFEPFEQTLARYYAADTPTQIPALLLEARVALWRDDTDARREVAVRLDARLSHDSRLRPFARLLANQPDEGSALIDGSFDAKIEAAISLSPNPEFRTSIRQTACELAAHAGQRDVALRWLEAATSSPLPDLDWLEHCCALAPLRGEQLYRQTQTTARARAGAIWWARR